MKQFVFACIATALFVSCSKTSPYSLPTPEVYSNDNLQGIIWEEDFTKGEVDWVADFAEYPVGQEAFYELDWGVRQLPYPLHPDFNGLLVSSNNHTDDVFMFIKKKVTGLKPNTTYNAWFDVEFATDGHYGPGIGGSPGEDVFFGIGVTEVEPEKIINGNNYIMNIDKGNALMGGKDRNVIGNISNGLPYAEYRLVSRQGLFTFISDTNGESWISLSTDSGHEGTTSLYFTRVNINFEEKP